MDIQSLPLPHGPATHHLDANVRPLSEQSLTALLSAATTSASTAVKSAISRLTCVEYGYGRRQE